MEEKESDINSAEAFQAQLTDYSNRQTVLETTLGKRKREDELFAEDYCPHLEHVLASVLKDQKDAPSCSSSATCMGVSINYAIQNPSEVPIDLSHQHHFEYLSKDRTSLNDSHEIFVKKGIVEEHNCKFTGVRHKNFVEPEGRRMYIRDYTSFNRPDNGIGDEIQMVKDHLTTRVLTASMVTNDRLRRYTDKDVIKSTPPEKFLRNKNGLFKTHAVVIYGYGITSGGDEYYHVRNPWGSRWSDGGNGRVACYYFLQFGVSFDPSFNKNEPVLEISSDQQSSANSLTMISGLYPEDVQCKHTSANSLTMISGLYSDEEDD